MSSHREAPEISKDPVADNTDVYAFVSPDNPTMVTKFAGLQPAFEGSNCSMRKDFKPANLDAS